MTYERFWERLIEYINEWASAREVPGGVEVTFEQSPGVTRTVEVVVTAADRDDYVSTICGTGDPRATPLKEKVLATRDGAQYLVYDAHDWEPSETRELPEDDFNFNSGPGEWMVEDAGGNVVDRFADYRPAEEGRG